MYLAALPALADNYARTLHGGAPAVVVDPVGAVPVLAAPDRLHPQVARILVTHPDTCHTVTPGPRAGCRATLPRAPIQ